MRLSNLGLLALGLVSPVLFALSSCGGNGGNGGSGGMGGGGSGGDDGGNNDGNPTDAPKMPINGMFCAPDFPNCVFPGNNAGMCPGGAPAIHVVYPNDGVLVPPNMNVISVQWTPFGSAFKAFEVDFENSITDMRVITKCAMQTVDTGQPPMPSGGCELLLDPNMWKFISDQNRGGDPLKVTVRGTTDGMCANSSDNSIQMSFASDDVLGGIYYWKSTVSANGVGGQIWVKSFGDAVPEQNVTMSLGSTCNGCHALSRDGLRMTIYGDDDDSDDEYGDVGGGLIDMTNKSVVGGLVGRGGPQPGFSAFNPDHTYFIQSSGQQAMNALLLFSGNNRNALATATIGASTDRPTMPDWSPDGKSIIYVLPQTTGQWNGHTDDDHVFGGSLMVLPYNGNMQFGAPAPFLMSKGENNYYPSYSPDNQFVLFNRVPNDPSAGAIDGCVGTAPQRSCPNDSFSNPKARVWLMANKGGASPIDLENANGSPAAQPVPFSNSWPRWSPFLQKYKGNLLLWITYSSTRDYGLRVRNHKTGMYQCYPADSYEDPGSPHRQPFAPQCQQPQLWMAAINLSDASGKDPSHVAFWLPFQDITTHNHTPQWTQQVVSHPMPDGGACIPNGGDCRTDPSACCGGLACGADGTCQSVPR